MSLIVYAREGRGAALLSCRSDDVDRSQSHSHGLSGAAEVSVLDAVRAAADLSEVTRAGRAVSHGVAHRRWDDGNLRYLYASTTDDTRASSPRGQLTALRRRASSCRRSHHSSTGNRLS